MTLTQKIVMIYQEQGLKKLMGIVFQRIFRKKAKTFPLIKQLIAHQSGIEIGGPSPIFAKGSFLPLYPHIDHLDNCNFSTQTLWNKDLKEGLGYSYHPTKQQGYQFIHDAIDLTSIQSDKYDFLLSSHVLEHIANPIKALREWKRILKPNGHLILLLPHKDGTFDHKRPTTSLNHLIEDYAHNIGEDDLTHLEEILASHDFFQDAGSENYERFKVRSYDNIHNRALHHHVFTTPLLAQLIDHLGLQIKSIEAIKPMHILLVAQKISSGTQPNNSAYLASPLHSIFPSDVS